MNVYKMWCGFFLMMVKIILTYSWIKVDLSELHRIAETYDKIIDRLKSIQRKAPKRVGRLLKKYYARRRNGVEDFLNKLVVQLSREFPDAVFVFEDLNKLKCLMVQGCLIGNSPAQLGVKSSRNFLIVFQSSWLILTHTSSTCPRCRS